MIALPFLFSSLLIAISPVVYLLLDELTSRDGPEWGTRQIQVCSCAQRHQALVVHFSGFQLTDVVSILADDVTHLLSPLQGWVFLVVEVLGVLAPCSVVILVEHDTVPVHGLYPLVSGLDPAYSILAQHILERRKAYKRLAFIHIVKLTVVLFLAELPTLKVLMGQQIFLPCCLYGRFESQHQHLRPSHP